MVDPEMGKGQMLDGELCVMALPKRQLHEYIVVYPIGKSETVFLNSVASTFVYTALPLTVRLLFITTSLKKVVCVVVVINNLLLLITLPSTNRCPFGWK